MDTFSVHKIGNLDLVFVDIGSLLQMLNEIACVQIVFMFFGSMYTDSVIVLYPIPLLCCDSEARPGEVFQRSHSLEHLNA